MQRGKFKLLDFNYPTQVTMANSSHSSSEDLNAVIQNSNPFDKPLIVRDKNVWGKGFPDVPSLNSHASNAVFQAMKEARKDRFVNSITITAEPGSGKSHIISRIKHHLPEEDVLFIYMNRYSDLKLIKCQFQQVLADSLNKFGGKEVTQWQELAAAMTNQARGTKQPPKNIVGEFSEISLAQIDKLTSVIQETKSNLDPDIVKAILWTLSPGKSSYASKWLSGKDISTKKADELDLPHSKNQENEAGAFDTAKQILDLISDYYSLIVCFDELDGIGQADPDQSDPIIGGYSQPQVVANLVKDLFNSLNQGTILTVMQLDTWRYQIEGMPNPSAIKARLSSKGEPIPLHAIDEQSIVELVSLWLKDFYATAKLDPPNPIYPFTQIQLKELAKRKLPVRDVLNWCRNNFKVSDTGGEVENFVKKELERDEIHNLNLDDNLLISNILLFVFRKFIGQIAEEIKIEDVVEFNPQGKKKNYINLELRGKRSGKVIKAGIAVFQNSNQNAVRACLNQLIDCSSLGLTCSFLIRSKDKSIKSDLALTALKKLTSTSVGKLVSFQIEDLRILAAIFSVYNKRQSYNLGEEDISAYILEEHSVIRRNTLVQDILTSLAHG
jgi:hypothetical protein